MNPHTKHCQSLETALDGVKFFLLETIKAASGVVVVMSPVLLDRREHEPWCLGPRSRTRKVGFHGVVPGGTNCVELKQVGDRKIFHDQV